MCILIAYSRFSRNASVRKEYTELKRTTYSKIETQLFNTKCSTAPTILQFHPYDQQIAAVGRDSFG